MLPSTPQVEIVYFGSKDETARPGTGILDGLRDIPGDTEPLPLEELDSDSTASLRPRPPWPQTPHTLLVDGTTLDPTFTISLAEKVHTAFPRTAFLDAPVSGGQSQFQSNPSPIPADSNSQSQFQSQSQSQSRSQSSPSATRYSIATPTATTRRAHAGLDFVGVAAARAGTLSIMLGSPSEEATSLAMPLLQRMARPGGIVACGRNGAGIGAKVCNNLVLAINQIALAEGLSLGKSLGIEESVLHQVINSSSGQSWSSRSNSPLPSVALSPGSRGFEGGFRTSLMLKDVGLALHAAHEYDLPTPLGWAARSVYEAVSSEGAGELADKDFSVVYQWLRDKQAEGVERGWKAEDKLASRAAIRQETGTGDGTP